MRQAVTVERHSCQTAAANSRRSPVMMRALPNYDASPPTWSDRTDHDWALSLPSCLVAITDKRAQIAR
jgi:hypothetical protein